LRSCSCCCFPCWHQADPVTGNMTQTANITVHGWSWSLPLSLLLLATKPSLFRIRHGDGTNCFFFVLWWVFYFGGCLRFIRVDSLGFNIRCLFIVGPGVRGSMPLTCWLTRINCLVTFCLLFRAVVPVKFVLPVCASRRPRDVIWYGCIWY
jgi:hypothetical protein